MSSMSTISFPNSHSRDTPSDGGAHQQHINFFPAAYDPHASSSSFQINPLSSHPPRTPHASISGGGGGGGAFSSGAAFSPEVYSERGEERAAAPSEEGDDEDAAAAGRRRVRKEEVWREVLASSTGRDKALKLIQYSMRVYLLFHASARGARAPWEAQLFRRLDSTMAGLSLTRKCLILFNWLTPLTAITAPQPLPFASAPKTPARPPAPAPLLHRFLHAPPPVLLDLLNALADDVATLTRLGLVGRRVGARAENLANWCWFSGTLVGLVEVGVEQGLVKNLMDETEARMYAGSFGEGKAVHAADEREMERLRKQYYWLRISRAKLLMDLIFVSYECFKFKRARGPAMGISGLLSAVLSSVKLYDRHRTALVKSLSH